MNKPYIDSIITKSDSKYLLIVAAAKRARQITLTEPELTRSGKINPVSAALHEINDDELSWELVSLLQLRRPRRLCRKMKLCRRSRQKYWKPQI